MERRDFFKKSCALCLLSLVPPAVIESCKKAASTAAPSNVNFTIDLSNAANAALKSVGGYVVQNSVIVIHAASGYVALSDICTHEGCSVGYDAASTHLVCPCHGGTFDLNGAVVAGPPPSALVKYKVSQSGNIITVTS